MIKAPEVVVHECLQQRLVDVFNRYVAKFDVEFLENILWNWL